MATKRLGPYPKATWADHVESMLRGCFGISIGMALFRDASWWTVLTFGLLALAWSGGMAVRDAHNDG